jgi:prepilin-type N-terminal cleavage/methylation domain-containing protein
MRFHLNSIRAPERRATVGFTLVELLVVIAIIAILAALLLPALSRAKESSQSAKCRGNIRQLLLGTLMYVDDFRVYPPFFKSDGIGSFQLWYGALRPYTLNEWTNPVYRCPAYKGPTAAPPQTNVAMFPLGGYGYNGYS